MLPLLPPLRSLLSSAAELVLFPLLLTLTIVTTLAAHIRRGFKPLFLHWTLRFTIACALKRFFTERYGEALAREPVAGRFRRATEVIGSIVGWFSCRRHRTVVKPEVVGGLEHLWLTSRDASACSQDNKNRYVVLYYHGGGYALYTPRYFIDFCNTLRAAVVRELEARDSNNVQVDFFLANYRKTPAHKFPVPAHDALHIYEYLVKHHKIPPRNIIIAGDSAGGGLVMSTLLGLRDAGKEDLMPLAAMVLCGYLDLTDEPKDFVPSPHCGLSQTLMRSFQRAALANPGDEAEARRHSAVHADLRGLPPVLVQATTLDYLYYNSVALIAKAKADGVANWDVDIHADMPHVFMTAPPSSLPYSAIGVQRIAAYAVKQIEASRA